MPKFIITMVFETDKEIWGDADEMITTILDEGLDIKDKSTKLIKAGVVEKGE